MRVRDLLDILDDLKDDEFDRFIWSLKNEKVGDIEPIKARQLEKANRQHVVDLMVQKYELAGAVEFMKSILNTISRNDLEKKLSNIGSRTGGQSQKETNMTSHPDSRSVRRNSLCLDTKFGADTGLHKDLDPPETVVRTCQDVTEAERPPRSLDCNVSEISYAPLGLAVMSNSSFLDLSNKNLQDPDVKLLCDFLKSLGCRVETLRLTECGLSETQCEDVLSALKSNTHLTELYLSYNRLSDSAVKLLSAVLESPTCRLKTLRLTKCELSETACKVVVSALKSNPHLTELYLSYNRLSDSGVKLLSAVLGSPTCRLETLRLVGCNLSKTSCDFLALALMSNSSSHLRELHLSWNSLSDSDVKQLCDLQESPRYKLEILGWRNS